jgi:hypothetical protein
MVSIDEQEYKQVLIDQALYKMIVNAILNSLEYDEIYNDWVLDDKGKSIISIVRNSNDRVADKINDLNSTKGGKKRNGRSG